MNNEAEQVLTASYDMTDAPLQINDIPGLRDAIERVADAEGGRELVRCEDRVMDYDVYWNDKTETVRIGAVAMLASYEVDLDGASLADYAESEADE